MGRIVFLDECDTQITVYRPSPNPLQSAEATREIETYCKITTSSGLEGWVRIDRVDRLEGRVAIATGDVEIPVVTGAFSQTFSRSVGTYVKILDESTDHFQVSMPWSDPVGIVGQMMRTPGDSSSYVVLDETQEVAVPVSFQSASENATDRVEQISGFPLSMILDGLSKQFNQVVTIEDLSALMCRLDVNAFTELGFSALGSGAGIRAVLHVSQHGFSYDYDFEVMRVGNRDLRTLTMLKRLRCNGATPDRMDAFEISGQPSPGTKNAFFLYREEEDDSSIRQGGRQVMFTIGRRRRLLRIRANSRGA